MPLYGNYFKNNFLFTKKNRKYSLAINKKNFSVLKNNYINMKNYLKCSMDKFYFLKHILKNKNMLKKYFKFSNKHLFYKTS